MLCNGYGEHNIQGIGDKHIPLIHNVMNTDVVIGVSDAASDALNLLFGSERGRGYLSRRRKIDPDLVRQFDDIGISGLANIVAADQARQAFRLRPERRRHDGRDRQLGSLRQRTSAYLARRYPGGFDEVNAGEIFGRHLEGIADDHVMELGHVDRKRVFNLGYYTWVEQQGVSVEDFDRRKNQDFWRAMVDSIPAWDRLIQDFNAEVGGRNSP